MPELDQRELATVLAALRHYQESGFGDMTRLPPQLAAIAVDGETNRVPLDDNEIDSLCERLNCSMPTPRAWVTCEECGNVAAASPTVNEFHTDACSLHPDNVEEDDEQCPECQRSFGPHYTGPCSH